MLWNIKPKCFWLKISNEIFLMIDNSIQWCLQSTFIKRFEKKWGVKISRFIWFVTHRISPFFTVMDPTDYRASYVQCAAEFTRKMTSSRCQGNNVNATVAAMPVFSTDSVRYMAPLQPVMIPFPSPPPSPLHVSPVLTGSTSLTREIRPESPVLTSMTRDTRFISSQEPKLGSTSHGALLWRPW